MPTDISEKLGLTHQPKGGMCLGCAHKHNDCSHLPFNTMPVIGMNGTIKIVACTEYTKHD